MVAFDDHLETKLVHGAKKQTSQSETGAVNVPIHLSSTFHQKSFDSFGPYDYSRSGNPTRDALEEIIADLEEGTTGLAFASGMAAISAAFMLVSAGDHVLVSKDVYGGTYRLTTELLTRFNIDHTFVDMTNLEETAKAVQPNTKVIYVETPANPLMNITDIEGIVKIAKANNCLTFVDNTFMTPLYQKPLNLGVDIVLHSATKFLSGHSDVVAGLAVTRDKQLGERLKFIQNTLGSILGPQDSWLLIRGIKTLSARLDRSTESAKKITDFLLKQSIVEKVYYPGLESHPGFSIHQRQSTSGGALLSFRLPDRETTKAFVEAIKYPVFAVSLGAVESILSYPATMSHAAMPKEEREARGITDGLLRLSVGLENVDDLIADIKQALQVAVNQHTPETSI
ncbi:cystathionine beta-lyase [Aquibacillus rhizosphaerae]|uniref:cysteine-S-conjugate beta-lyase n=1 Tax=Aquibacillus rhizosphaerae TaxID=3051431 RepID=A0ABT7LB27_9BACI|nr:cystathionine beta-lyase [Aquibacillus sp. LR5S19]MDL4843053.1 cystathionine beta-lyase [Aquibacillus sp. LR5S19]